MPTALPRLRHAGAVPWQQRAPHGIWHAPAPRADGRVELCYGRFDAGGRLPGLPLPIGLFAALPEAMLAVEMHEAALRAPPGAAAPPAEPWRLLTAAGEFVLRRHPGCTRLELEAAGRSDLVAELRDPAPLDGSDVTLAERPPGLADPATLDAAILRRLAALRARRGAVPPAWPLVPEEVARWRAVPD